MAKYDPLRRCLARQKTVRVELSFADVERLIGAYLPKAATRAAWWSGEDQGPNTTVQVQAWRAAGYRAALAGGERVLVERR
jgi:hypothetical protein